MARQVLPSYATRARLGLKRRTFHVPKEDKQSFPQCNALCFEMELEDTSNGGEAEEVVDTFCTRNTLKQRGMRNGKHFKDLILYMHGLINFVFPGIIMNARKSILFEAGLR